MDTAVQLLSWLHAPGYKIQVKIVPRSSAVSRRRVPRKALVEPSPRLLQGADAELHEP